jgi:hypothetical protein
MYHFGRKPFSLQYEVFCSHVLQQKAARWFILLLIFAALIKKKYHFGRKPFSLQYEVFCSHVLQQKAARWFILLLIFAALIKKK